MVSYMDKLYVGGEFTGMRDSLSSVNYIAAYDPITLTISNLPIGTSNGVNNQVYTLAVYNGELYIGGIFSSLGDDTISAKHIVAYDGTAFTTLSCGGDTSNGVNGDVYALAVYKDQLYIGGYFSMLGDGSTSAKYIVAWDGTAFRTLPSSGSLSNNGVGGTVNSLAVYNNQLYIGGWFSRLGDGSVVNGIVAWDGTVFTTLPGLYSIGVSGGSVNALAVYDNQLYLGGSFSTLSDGTYVNGLVVWNGNDYFLVQSTAGVKIVPDPYSASCTVTSFCTGNGKLYIGGSFTSLSDGTIANRIVGYDGMSWTNVTIGNATGIADGTVNSLYADGTTLYIGGSFKTLGDGTVINYLAWTVPSLTYPDPSTIISNTPTSPYIPSVTPIG